jgi:hypothetical protein
VPDPKLFLGAVLAFVYLQQLLRNNRAADDRLMTGVAQDNLDEGPSSAAGDSPALMVHSCRIAPK